MRAESLTSSTAYELRYLRSGKPRAPRRDRLHGPHAGACGSRSSACSTIPAHWMHGEATRPSTVRRGGANAGWTWRTHRAPLADCSAAGRAPDTQGRRPTIGMPQTWIYVSGRLAGARRNLRRHAPDRNEATWPRGLPDSTSYRSSGRFHAISSGRSPMIFVSRSPCAVDRGACGPPHGVLAPGMPGS